MRQPSLPLVDPHHARRATLLVALLGLGACGGGRGSAPGGPPSVDARNRGAPQLSFDATPVYRQAGLIARGLPFPILGRAAFFGSASPDTTHVVIAISFANASLAFAREADDRFRANYEIQLNITGGDVAATARAEERVLVGTFRETTRTDETVLFQEILDVPPGTYSLGISVRDLGSQRSVEEQVQLRVPRLDEGSLSSPVPIAEATPRTGRAMLPNLLVSPTGTAVVGRDSVIPIYVESYLDSPAPIHLLISSERGRVMWHDTVEVASRAGLRSGVIDVPVGRIGIGAARVTLVRDGASDSSSAYLFVGFGAELPVASYDDMLSYLRYFATSARIERLRTAAEEDRPAAWAEFVRATDSDPLTPEHEELRAYFGRLMRANSRFREEATPGWLNDRGRVYIMLGDPDHIIEPPINDTQRGRQQLWEYRTLNLQLVFYDQTGAGRWRLTQSSEVRFETESRRRLR